MAANATAITGRSALLRKFAGRPLGQAPFGATTVRSWERIAEIAGLTDESVCPTLARIGLRFCGAGAFACQPIVSQLLTVAAPLTCGLSSAFGIDRPGGLSHLVIGGLAPREECDPGFRWRARLPIPIP